MPKLSLRARLLLVTLLLVAIIGGGGIWFVSRPAGVLMPEVLTALKSDATVAVSRSPGLTFRPADAPAKAGLIFYPGGRVVPEAYAPLGRAIAEAGYLAVMPAMPLNLAILNPDAANAIIDAYPDIERWVIAGHSLGGVMAARYAHNHPARIHGLALVAAYPEAGVDLSARDLPVASIYAELDGLATVADIEASFTVLPPDAQLVQIEGGNHANFGWYGAQSGDNPATISREEQSAQFATAILQLLERATL